jgi:hypothetical protein
VHSREQVSRSTPVPEGKYVPQLVQLVNVEVHSSEQKARFTVSPAGTYLPQVRQMMKLVTCRSRSP